MFKRIITGLVDQPFLTSIFVTDFFILSMGPRLPMIASFLMLGLLVAMTMYFGQKLSLFKI
ncbi:MAG: hypothetical protein WCI06_02780 [Methylococcaceae bacterium]